MPSILCFKDQSKNGLQTSLAVLVLLSLVQNVHSAYDTFQSGCSAGQYLSGDTGFGSGTALVCRPCNPGYYCSGGNKLVQTPCPNGYYSFFGATSCTKCPQGMYCSPGYIPRPCPAGQYSEAGSTGCTNIPNGYYAVAGVLTPCAPGEFCSWGGHQYSIDRVYASKPRKCAAGWFCFADQMIICPDGTYSAEGASVCTAIVPGQYRISHNHPPGTCPPGTTQPKYAVGDACASCPAGYQCLDPTKPPVRCAPGTIAPFGKKTTCDPCPAGFQCPDPTALPQICPWDGTLSYYSLASQPYCTLCPAGYKCDNPALAPTACNAGWYSELGVPVCRPCPAGYYCPVLSQIVLDGSTLQKDVGSPLTCPMGTYSSPGQAVCTSCPAGTYCPYKTDGSLAQQPSLCPPGMYSQGGATVCSECPAGSKCINTAGTPLTACGAYQITSSLHETCFDCPAGYACPHKDFEQIVACGPGFYSTTSMNSCDVSGAGYYAPTTQAAPIAVSTGYFAEIGFTHQTLPHPGFEMKTNEGRHTVLCKPGWYTTGSNGACTQAAAGTFAPLSYTLSGFRSAGLTCPDGTWATAGSLECHICTPGYQCNDKTVVPTTTCKSLTNPVVGQYNVGGNKTCGQCPSGYECSKGETISPCPPWHYSDGTSATAAGDCYPCQDGYECSSGLQVQCGAGFYASGQINYCTPCPPGYKCPNAGTGTPTICPGGTFSNEQSTSCTNCPADYYSIAGQASCTPVPPGFYIAKSGTGEHTGVAKCGQTTYSDWGDNGCTVCPNGYLCSEKSQFYWWEQSCPRGSYCIAGVQTLCPVGTFGVKERAVSLADGCATCPPGYYCAPGTEHFMLSPCPPGAYCPAGSDKVACPSGTTRSDLFGQTIGDCSACAAGTSCGSGDTSGGSTCDLGYYCPSGVPAPGLPCPAGTYGGYKTGKIDPNQCLTCPPGYYCPSGSANPTPAPAGYYSAAQGIDSINGLSLCPPKYYCPLTGMTSYKGYYCTPGYYCPAGSTSSTQVPCPAGTYSDTSDIYDASQCLPCPRGFMCDSGATSLNGKIQLCPMNNFCELGSVLNSANNNCPAGTYAPYTRSMSMFDCLPCPAGSYCLQGAAPVACPAGAYCPVGTQKATQFLCKQGYYSSLTGLKDATQCLHCGVGVSCPSIGMTAPVQCVNGLYNDYSTTALYCDSCPAGYYCTTASIHPVVCGYGFYSTIGQTACTACPVGHYCPEPTTTQVQMLANKCPGGTICKKSCTIGGVATFCGLSTYPTFESQANGGNACSKNSFCPPGTIAEFTNITAQVTMQNLGSSYLSSAIPIPAGFIDNLLTVCPKGFYCPQGTLGAANQIGCPLGTFRADTMGMDVTDCGVCPAGYYCGTIGTWAPVICPTGFFCPEGTSLPTPCPLGTFNALTGIQDSRQCQSCSAGFYCPILGQSAVDPTMVCDAGFICYGRAFRPEPTDFTTGAICPSGGYCLQGGTTQSQCAAGWIGLFQGAYDNSACVKCQAGYYCKGAGGSATSAQICPAGSLCPEGSFDYVTATPPQPGFYSTTGQATAIQCPFGTYQNVAGQSSCLSCNQGFFCNSIQLADPTLSSQCPAGFYCPSYQTTVTNGGLPYQIYPCPEGTYLNLVSKSSVSDCIKCPPGLACETKGISDDLASATVSATYKCAAGFYCALGSSSRYPYTADPSGGWGPCPPGSYCPLGTSVPIPCPDGTFSNQERAIDLSYCMECPPGYICPQPSSGGLTAPYAAVAAGYLTSDKINSDVSCQTSAGFYCPLGSFSPSNDASGNPLLLRCPTGFFQDTNNQGNCQECPVGKYCMLGSSQACPAGYLCP